MTTLVGLPYSPWSEKARFALEVRRAPFPYRHYQPLLGEPSLRLATRQSAVLAFVSPPSFGLRIGRASRRSFSDPELAERYADLLEWRDALYEAHRPRTK